MEMNYLYSGSVIKRKDESPPLVGSVKAHSGIIGNDGADACARIAALTYTMGIALPDARDPFHNIYWLSLNSSHGRSGDPHHSHTAPNHYFTNLTSN
eukprot:1158679-Pelagomonas_calceolata.AAC.2